MQQLWSSYLKNTPQRVKLIDAFMGFLVVVGGLQFLYCLVVGNYVSLKNSLFVRIDAHARRLDWGYTLGVSFEWGGKNGRGGIRN